MLAPKSRGSCLYLQPLDRYNEMNMVLHTGDALQPVGNRWLGKKMAFFSALLAGEHRQCLKIAVDSVATAKELEELYLLVIQPIMYEIGTLWENGKISVAEEHLASAIVSRVMAAVHMIPVKPDTSKGKAVIASAPNEFHEIGAWMISDVLESVGWQVRYLGANAPLDGLLAMLHNFHPDIFLISATMHFNILKVTEIISKMRTEADLCQIKVMVGGRVFNEAPDIWSTTGADGFAANARTAKKLAEKWKKK